MVPPRTRIGKYVCSEVAWPSFACSDLLADLVVAMIEERRSDWPVPRADHVSPQAVAEVALIGDLAHLGDVAAAGLTL